MNFQHNKSLFSLLGCLLTLSAWGQTPDKSLEKEVDGIVTHAIQQQAFPGCVVYAARKGKPFFRKAYGHMTYDSTEVVNVHTIYDLASVTKVTAATLSIMKLWEEGLLDLDASLGEYVDGFKPSISDLTIKELLVHQSGMPAWINFYEKMKVGYSFRNETLSRYRTDQFNYRINDSLFVHENVYQTVKALINEEEVSSEKKYQYSGLFFYVVPELVFNITGKPFEDYLKSNFYGPMNANTLSWNPLELYNQKDIAPTELDTLLRMGLIRGTVHDEGAALMRGVSGNAGLFGQVDDLAKVWQMFLSDGELDTVRYLNPETVSFFTGMHFPQNDNHRGLGFDKPKFEYDLEKCNYASSASIRSYGHLGFTGTMVWADPDQDLLFILLSNRVYPSRFPYTLKELQIRPLLHQVFYDYILSKYPD